MNAKLANENVQNILKYSLNDEAQKLYERTSNKNVKYDCIINDITSKNGLERHQVKTKCRSILSKEFKQTTWNNLLGLKKPSTIVSSTVSSSFAKDMTTGQNVLKRLPVNIYNFARRYLILNLANNSNLFVLGIKWEIWDKFAESTFFKF